MEKPSPSALKAPIITIHRGLAIYQINASPYWYARIRVPNGKKNLVRSTKETSRLEARKLAEELYLSVLGNKGGGSVPREFNGVPSEHFALYLKECEWRFNTPGPKRQLTMLRQWVRKNMG